MFFKSFSILLALSASSAALADLNSPYKLTTGERLAECVERHVPLMDRVTVSAIRSYTKYDKHYVALNTTSIYVDFTPQSDSLNVIFVNNNNVAIPTSAEAAKKTLQSINESLIKPSIGYCSKILKLDEEIMFSMVFVDPPLESRRVKNVIKMDASGKFTLP